MVTHFMRRVLPFFVSAISFSIAQASIVDELYKELRDQPIDYTVFGTVCEQVAKLQIKERYDATDYDVETGIVYGSRHSTIDELDVVVLRKDDQEAVLVAEVKCWKNLEGAQHKAQDQISRFQKNIPIGRKIDMHSDAGKSRTYRMDQFDENPEFITISQQGGETHGFDETIPISLDEAYELHKLLTKPFARRNHR